MIRGATIQLRPLEETDAERIRQWRMDERTRQAYMGYRFPVIAAAERDWVMRVADPSNREQVYLGVEHPKDGLIGFVNLREIDWVNRVAKLGMLIAASHQGQGYGREALSLLLRYGLHELNLRRIELEVRADNQRAIALYRAAGFREEGRLRQRWADDGAYIDVVVMGLLRSEAE